MGWSVCPDERRCTGAVEEISSGTGAAGASLENLRRPSCDTFSELQVEAEEQPDIAESFEIEAVPTFLILQVEYTGCDSLALLIPCTVFRATRCWLG